MANQIPIRPWSRLSSLRVPSQESTEEPCLKSTNTSSNDNGESATKSLPTATAVHSPMQSQKFKLTTPITFPPSKLKARPQIDTKIEVEEEETIENRNGNGNGTGQNEKQVRNKENETKRKGIHSKLSGSEGGGIRVITISGENLGGCMKITKSQKIPFHKMGNSGAGEVNVNRKNKSEKGRTLSSPPMTAVYANSNVQCVNNSMVYNTSLTHHDPGVHLIIPKKPFGKGFHLKERDGGQNN